MRTAGSNWPPNSGKSSASNDAEKQDQKASPRALLSICLLLLLAQPVSAQELGEANITPGTKMGDIRSNPSIVGAGIYTYSLDQDRPLDRLYWNTQTLNRLSNRWTAQDSADGLNYLIRTYNAGQQVTFPLYTEEEIAQDTSRDGVELYYMPPEGEQTHRKFVLVMGGNAIVVSAEIREGISTAWNLHEMGYPVFVLRYRIGMKASNNAPLEDLARAVQYITQHADRFGVQAEDYAIVSYSSGGQIAGVFGDAETGWLKNNVPKAGALLLAYPINNFWLAKPAYTALLDVDDWMQKHYYDYTLSKLIAPDYPPVFLWYGKGDHILKLFGFDQQGPALQSALEIDGVPHEEKVYEDAGHGIGIGLGTDAEGWLNAAVAFWKKVT